MRAMRRARTHRHSVVRALAAALLSAVPLAAAGSPAVAADSVELPVVRSTLAPDDPCAKASPRTARSEPWTVRALGLARASMISQGAGVTVAVVDTGVGTGIPGLSGRVSAVGGADEDCVGHGSFAAGLIAAARIDGVGPVGVAPGARILAVRGTDERGVATAELLADGIRAAADGGAGVIYVGSALATGKSVLTAAVAHATERDALVIAPAAPDALPVDRSASGGVVRAEPWYWPAAVPEVLSVTDYGPGGTRPANAPVVSAVDLAAPGDAVVSVGPKGPGHFLGSGASLAAAHVAGAAALVRAQHPDMTAAQVSRQLTVAAYPASPPRLDPYAAMTAVLTGARGTVPRPAPARVITRPSTAPRDRALIIAGVGTGLVLLTAAAAVVIPRGKARGWRPAGE
ncbi:S8 family serine peptidase [Streptomyces sp. AK02-01A]|uniref:S8 family serine peptidase n=1 Tax=Streptomyces sp. AK02-01A TaxID=3028648 RepID=UPI0029B41018|nr:S8 family serine peptidase [Streptomyces sp. AK02-01A]MDX3850310.1 S8 family serine peptidase [Streptomyces sp. AK02-01A]